MKRSMVRMVLVVMMGMGNVPGWAWTDLGGGDHGGSNWVIAGGAYVASNHYNIGTVTISSGSVAYVKAWDGAKYGGLDIRAVNISINGILDASGSGYGGGNGGAGGTGSTTVNAAGGAGTTGANGAGSYGGAGGVRGVGGYDSASNPGMTRQGGWAAAGCTGGYAVAESQGDITTNDVVWMGSGGGGGGGGGAGWNLQGTTSGGGGGGGGNAGGGWISLVASNSIVIRGSVLAKGRSMATGNGGTGQTGMNPGGGGSGGNASGSGASTGGNGGASVLGTCYSGGRGGGGGSGAGGGILLSANSIDTLGGTLDNRGGGDGTVNGGTLKVFYVDLQGGTYPNTGRVFLKLLMPPEPGTVFEF